MQGPPAPSPARSPLRSCSAVDIIEIRTRHWGGLARETVTEDRADRVFHKAVSSSGGTTLGPRRLASDVFAEASMAETVPGWTPQMAAISSYFRSAK